MFTSTLLPPFYFYDDNFLSVTKNFLLSSTRKTFSIISKEENFLRHFDFPPDATPMRSVVSDIENLVKHFWGKMRKIPK